MEYNLEDFIPVYPKQDDPDIQYKIGIKKEFLEVQGISSEPIPKPGKLFRHQKAFLRYMLQMDRMLNIQETGTGKTCAIVAIAEFFKKNKDYKRAYILESGKSNIQEFKKQIANSCTTGEYLTEKVEDITATQTARQGALTREINKYYSVMSYGAFAKEVAANGLNQEEIDRKYSGCIFFIDEAHNLNSDPEMKDIVEETGDPVDMEDKDSESRKEKTYNILWELFHKVKRSKIILGTATPMLNEVDEFPKLMNLILPVDMQMPLKWDYNKVSLTQLEPFLRGRVSYVRALETGIDPEYQGKFMNYEYKMIFAEPIQDIPFLCTVKDENGNIISEPKQPNTVKTFEKNYKSQNRVYPLVMSDFQFKGYLNSLYTDETSKSKKGSFHLYERNASCMVFPDGDFNLGDFTRNLNESAAKYLTPSKKSGEFEFTKGLTNFIRKDNIDDLQKYSTKYHFILKNELEAAYRRSQGEIVGNAFIYSELVTQNGAIILGKLLEYYGFEKYNRSSSAFVSTKSGKIIDSNLTKKLRYGILTSDMDDSSRSSLLELVNSKNNLNGEYCQVLIGTPASRDGINVFSVLRGYLLLAGWHPSGTHQALSRFIRSNSHEYIKEALAEKRRDVDASIIQPTIKVYKLAAIESMNEFSAKKIVKQDNKTKITDNGTISTVDLNLYSLCDRKEIEISRMMRFLKQCAFDCSIHYMRNVRMTDQNGSRQCDYDDCMYHCFTSEMTNFVKDEDIDFTTYDILYSQEIIEDCRDVIVDEMRTRSSITIEELYNLPSMNFYKNKFINMAIDMILKERKMIRNSFGFKVYINSDGVNLFTQAEMPTFSQRKDYVSMSLYKNMMFGIKSNNIEKIISILSVNEDRILERIQGLTDIFHRNYEEFSRLVDELTYKRRLEILEESITNKIENDFTLAVKRKFSHYIFSVNEPIEDIENVKIYLNTSNERRGRNRKETKCPKVNIPMKGENKDGELIFLHDYSEFNNQLFNASDNIRIFKSSEQEYWRDAYDYECQAYKNLINKVRQEKISEVIKKFPQIGTILEDKKFRIIDTDKLNFESTDKRGISQGLECNSYNPKINLIEILIRSRYTPQEISSVEIPENMRKREDFENFLIYGTNKSAKSVEELSRFTLDDLKLITKWVLSNLAKDKICVYVKELFIKENRMYIV